MPEFYCPCCGSPMKFVEKLRLTVNCKGTAKYRRRRFACTGCDYKETIFADGEKDTYWEPKLSIDEVNKVAQREESARGVNTSPNRYKKNKSLKK